MTAPFWRAALLWGGGGTLIFALSAVSVAYTFPDLPVAFWWPAAGASTVLALRARASQRPVAIALIVVATALGNLVAGRTPGIGLLYGVANALEITILVWLLTRGGRDPRLHTANDAARFIARASAAAAVYAATIAVVNAALGTGEALTTAAITGASHLSAVVLIAPLALFDREPQQRPSTGEIVAQSAALVVVLVVGVGAVSRLPLAFLVFVPLAWAALRFPPRLAHLQALAVAATTVIFSRLSLAALTPLQLSPTELALTVAVFLAAIGVFTVLIAAERNESLVNARTAVDAAEDSAEAVRATTATMQVRSDLERQRQDFLSTTSHELRTPVTIIAGYTELLSETELPAGATGWVDAIDRNTTRLAAMLDDLLAFSRTQAEQPRPCDVTASDLLTAVVDRYRPAATARHIAMSAAASSAIWLHVDRDDADRALGNLVSNAVKFTPDGGRVQIETTVVAGDVLFTVSDTGHGIGADALPQVFDPFYRGEQSEARALPGTGLGLPIARMLARRNGGEVMIVSPPGHGTKASLLLPRADTPGGGQ